MRVEIPHALGSDSVIGKGLLISHKSGATLHNGPQVDGRSLRFRLN